MFGFGWQEKRELLILRRLAALREDFEKMSAAFDELSATVDEAVAVLSAPKPVSGTPDSEIEAVTAKLKAALHPVVVAPPVDPAAVS